jgi:acyl dehydratase
MALNAELIGKEYAPLTITVEREHVLSFARAIAEDAPVILDAEAACAAGYPDQLAPPTFVTTMQIMTSAQIVADPELGLDYARVVHGEQAYEWHRPIRVGDSLTAVPRIAGISSKGPLEFLVVEAEIKDAAGETVVTARTTLLSRGTAGGGE